MSNLYGALYDSMIEYFRIGFARRRDPETAAASSVSLCLVLNLYSFVNFSAVFESRLTDLLDNGAAAVLVFVALYLANLGYGKRRKIRNLKALGIAAVSRKYAVTYIAISLISFIGSLVVLWYCTR